MPAYTRLCKGCDFEAPAQRLSQTGVVVDVERHVTPVSVVPAECKTGMTADGGEDISTVLLPLSTGEGRFALRLRARDAAGNIGPTLRHEWVVTTAAPSTEVLAAPAPTSGVDFAVFVASVSLPGAAAGDNATVQVRLGTGDWESHDGGDGGVGSW